jgi:hypothetical protein
MTQIENIKIKMPRIKIDQKQVDEDYTTLLLHDGTPTDFLINKNSDIINKHNIIVGKRILNKYCTIYINGEMLYVHRVVYEHFNQTKIPSGMQIDHCNHIKNDNHIENLRCVSKNENMKNRIMKPRVRDNKPKRVQITFPDDRGTCVCVSIAAAARLVGFTSFHVSLISNNIGYYKDKKAKSKIDGKLYGFKFLDTNIV